MKRILALLALVLLFSFPTVSAEIPDGFEGYAWGTDLDKINNENELAFLMENDIYSFYQISSSPFFLINDTKIHVFYVFQKNRLVKIMFDTDNFSIYYDLNLEKLFDGSKTRLTYFHKPADNSGYLVFSEHPPAP